jgi:hypothetical protein
MEGSWQMMMREVVVQNWLKLTAVADLVKNDCQIASRMIAESLNIPNTVVLPILKEKLVRTFCFTLLDTRAKGRSSYFLPRHYRDFFNKFTTEAKSWCFACDPETRQESSEWTGKTSPWPKKLKFQSPISRPCW